MCCTIAEARKILHTLQLPGIWSHHNRTSAATAQSAKGLKRNQQGPHNDTCQHWLMLNAAEQIPLSLSASAAPACATAPSLPPSLQHENKVHNTSTAASGTAATINCECHACMLRERLYVFLWSCGIDSEHG